MAHKVEDITRSANKFNVLSQTPKDYAPDNYFLKELQDKVDAEWEYRPNRISVDYESEWGKQVYGRLEVVVQSVKTDKGTEISDNIRRLVFRRIREDRFTIGSRFRLYNNLNRGAAVDSVEEDDPNYYSLTDSHGLEKDVWITVNQNNVNATSSVVVKRCNGTLGSVVTDGQGVSHYHYEPIIQGEDLSAVSLFYNETAVSPQSQLLIYAQHNEYTRNYFINQRFIIGYDKVYRIKAINKFNSQTTFDPNKVGLMRIYLELTESSPYDDFVNRIAYQMNSTVVLKNSDNNEYRIIFKQPATIPNELTSNPITFLPVLVDKGGNEISVGIIPTMKLENCPTGVDPSIFVTLDTSVGGNSFSLKRNRMYLNGDLEITCTVPEAQSPSGEAITTSFTMVVRRPE